MGRIGCYPGSFNPPTVAHLAVAEAAVRHAGLARLDLVVSRQALGKEDLEVPTLADRRAVLEAVAAARPWLGVAVTDARLIAEIAAGYDAVVVGADKWRQVLDPAWYADDAAARDAAVASLPEVLVAPRGDDDPSRDLDDVDLADPDRLGALVRFRVLELDAEHRHVSATAVREGHPHADGWILPEAVELDRRTGAWSDPDRYRRQLAGGR